MLAGRTPEPLPYRDYCQFSVSGYITGNKQDLHMLKDQRQAVSRFRKRLKERKITRLEVNVRKGDVTLVRNVARALLNPQQGQAARALLREHFGGRPVQGLKALLAAAPLEGIDLARETDLGREVEL